MRHWTVSRLITLVVFIGCACGLVESTQAQEQLTDRPNRVSQVATTNRGVAILHTQEGPYPGIGVGQILIGAGQVASDATVRVVATEKDQRIFYPAIEIVSIDSEPVVRSGTEDPNGPPSRRIGDGSVLKRLRKAVEASDRWSDPQSLESAARSVVDQLCRASQASDSPERLPESCRKVLGLFVCESLRFSDSRLRAAQTDDFEQAQ
ncbi:MAG: hypothetical protein LW720_13280 [Pirellula sp.]|nr:hypothetical protein [Pirellula sp.]